MIYASDSFHLIFLINDGGVARTYTTREGHYRDEKKNYIGLFLLQRRDSLARSSLRTIDDIFIKDTYECENESKCVLKCLRYVLFMKSSSHCVYLRATELVTLTPAMLFYSCCTENCCHLFTASAYAILLTRLVKQARRWDDFPFSMPLPKPR